MNQGEPLPASFQLVSQPEDADPIKALKEEARETRQEAVVKGITPSQPAPIPATPAHAEARGSIPAKSVPMAEAREGTWLSRMLGFFRAKPEPSIEVAAARSERSAAPADARNRDARARREPRREPQHGRDERRDRGHNRRDERHGNASVSPSPSREPGQRAPQPARKPKDQSERRDARNDERANGRREERHNEPRPPRQKPPRAEAPAVKPAAGPVAAALATAPHAEGDERREGGRRRRGRRGRGAADRGDKAEQVTHDVSTHERGARPEPVAPRIGLVDTPPPIEGFAVAASDITLPQGSAIFPTSIESEVGDAPIPPHRADVVENEPRRPLDESTPIAFVESVLTPTAPARPRNLPDIPPVSLALPPGSELELVQTREHVAAPVADEPAEMPRPKRVRPPRVESVSEPLELIETHKDTNPPAH